MINRRGLRIAAALAAAIPLMILMIPSDTAAAYELEETETVELSAEGVEKLAIIASSSDVSVTGTEEGGTMVVEIRRVVKADSEEEARKLAEKMRVEINEKGDLIELVTEYPDDGETRINILEIIFGGGRKLRMDLDIFVPKALDVTFDTASGDIEVENLNGDVGISTASGDVEAGMLTGKLIINTASGDIEADEIAAIAAETASGDVEASLVKGNCVIAAVSGDVALDDIDGNVVVKTISGDVEVTEVTGSVKLTVHSGDVSLDGIAGDIKAHTAGGDLYANAVPGSGPRKYELATSGGDLTLVFGAILQEGYVFQASTTTGNFQLDLPIEVSGMSRQRVSGVVRDGKSRVFIETSSGDITVKEKGV